MLSEHECLNGLSDNAFVQLWRSIVGEIPAILVERDVMVGILLDVTCPERRAQIYAAGATIPATVGWNTVPGEQTAGLERVAG